MCINIIVVTKKIARFANVTYFKLKYEMSLLEFTHLLLCTIYVLVDELDALYQYLASHTYPNVY